MKKLFLLFLEIILISIIFCGICGLNPPNSSDYCGNYIGQNETHKCCYCKNNDNNKYYCLVVINNNSISGYECECDNIQGNPDLPGAPCLNHSLTISGTVEITKEYCHGNSVDKRHPCCYYDDGNIQTCFSIGKITSLSLYTYNEFLDCFSNYQKINIIILFLIQISTF